MPKAVIHIWDAADDDLPGYTYETDDPQILSLIHDLFREEHFSVMQQPLVTRMEIA